MTPNRFSQQVRAAAGAAIRQPASSSVVGPRADARIVLCERRVINTGQLNARIVRVRGTHQPLLVPLRTLGVPELDGVVLRLEPLLDALVSESLVHGDGGALEYEALEARERRALHVPKVVGGEVGGGAPDLDGDGTGVAGDLVPARTTPVGSRPAQGWRRHPGSRLGEDGAGGISTARWEPSMDEGHNCHFTVSLIF
jgi:hypothetical protein